MLIHHSRAAARRTDRRPLGLALLLSTVLLGSSGCHFFQPSGKNTITDRDGKKIKVNDEMMKQYLAEWHNTKGSIERLASMESDLSFLLSEVSKLSDLGQTPGLGKPATSVMAVAAPAPSTPAVVTAPTPAPATPATTVMQTMQTAPAPQMAVAQPATISMPMAGNEANFINMNTAFCPEVFQNTYKKSLAFLSFPRMHVASSKIGALHQVEQHLPMLIGANLRNRHHMLTPTQIREGVTSANPRGELLSAAQAQMLAKQHRVQFVVSGEVDDMSMSFPDTIEKPSYYTRFVNGAHNFLNINTPLDKRSRVFSFTLEMRDGVTGQVVFRNTYKTFGKWKASPEATIGFGSPHFWTTDYGRQVQLLVAKASDEVAATLYCQPYLARVDSSPFQQQIVIQSGSNNGLRSGDSLDLYQVIYQPITGEYQQFDTRLVKHSGRVYLTEIYPSHSIGQVANQTLSAGQYVVKAQ